MGLFYSILIILIPLWLLSPESRKSLEFFKNKGNASFIVIFISILAVSVFLAPDPYNALWGGYEKRHGILLYATIGIFALLLGTLKDTHRRFFLRISFVSLFLVLVYAGMQWMGIDRL